MRTLLLILGAAGLAGLAWLLLAEGEDPRTERRPPPVDTSRPERVGPEFLSGGEFEAPPPRLAAAVLEARVGDFEGGLLPTVEGDRPLYGRDVLALLPEDLPVVFDSAAERAIFEAQKFVEWVPEEPDSRVGAEVRRWLEDCGWSMESEGGRLRVHRPDPDREVNVSVW